MLFVRLSHLMATKRLKIADICKDTDISRPTLTALYYGKGKGINFDTINKLCTYFHCQTNDLLYVYGLEIDSVEILSYEKQSSVCESSKYFALNPPIFRGEIRFKSSSFPVNRVAFNLGIVQEDCLATNTRTLFLESQKDVVFPFLPQDLQLDFASRVLYVFLNDIKKKYKIVLDAATFNYSRFDYCFNFAEK